MTRYHTLDTNAGDRSTKVGHEISVTKQAYKTPSGFSVAHMSAPLEFRCLTT